MRSSWLLLFNAWLNRRRDDRLRRLDAQALAAALLADLNGLENAFRLNNKAIGETDPQAPDSFVGPDFAHLIRVFPEMLSKIGLLGDPAMIEEVMKPFILVDQHLESMMMLGGQLAKGGPEHRRLIIIPVASAADVKAINVSMLEDIVEAKRRLRRYLG